MGAACQAGVLWEDPNLAPQASLPHALHLSHLLLCLCPWIRAPCPQGLKTVRCFLRAENGILHSTLAQERVNRAMVSGHITHHSAGWWTDEWDEVHVWPGLAQALISSATLAAFWKSWPVRWVFAMDTFSGTILRTQKCFIPVLHCFVVFRPRDCEGCFALSFCLPLGSEWEHDHKVMG